LWYIDSTVSGPPAVKCASTTAMGVPSGADANFVESTVKFVLWRALTSRGSRPRSAFAC
jgi:hypothetical protein